MIIKISKAIYLLGVLLLTSCSITRTASSLPESAENSLEEYCENSSQEFKSLYISKIETNLQLDEEEYNARVSFYYIPDSIFYLSAVNSGFEIVRIGMTRDSIVYIDRMDKVGIIIKLEDKEHEYLLSFEDVEDLVNRNNLCINKSLLKIRNELLVLEKSEGDIRKKIEFNEKTLAISRFEFYNKENKEYVVGEKNNDRSITIYTNYLVDDLVLNAKGGEIYVDREINVNLKINRSKYEVIYL